MSKVTERAIAAQLNAYFVANDLLPRHQWAYRQKHSTETVLLRVWSDVLTSADTREVTLLGLRDLSAAVDCVDNNILLQRIEVTFGLKDTVLDWVHSFVTGHTQQVTYCGPWSSVTGAACTVQRATGVGAWPCPISSLHC